MSKYRDVTRNDWIASAAVIAGVSALLISAAFFLAPKSLAGFVLLACVLLGLLIRWHAANFAYRCEACGHEFEITALQDAISPHMLETKYLRCPKCRARTWACCLRKLPHDTAS